VSVARKVVTFRATSEGFFPGSDTFPGPSLFPGWSSEAVLFDYFGTTQSGVHSTIRPVAGSCSLGLRGAGRLSHVIAGVCQLTVFGSSIARKLSPRSGSATLGTCAISVPRKLATPFGSGSLLYAGTGFVAKAVSVVGSAPVGLTSAGKHSKTVTSVGINVVVFTGSGTAQKQLALQGVCDLPVVVGLAINSRRAVTCGSGIIRVSGTVSARFLSVSRGSMGFAGREITTMAPRERRTAAMAGV
jgi:hypothetical protein